jgi:hypothetical protein
MLAFALGALIGAVGTGAFFLGAARNERAAFATTLEALAECRGLAEDYRGQLERARTASRELVEGLARTLPAIARIGEERERALGAVRALRGIVEKLGRAIEGEWESHSKTEFRTMDFKNRVAT